MIPLDSLMPSLSRTDDLLMYFFLVLFRCEVLVDPQPRQSWIGSWFRSKKAAGYKPDLVRLLTIIPCIRLIRIVVLKS